jgi:hypothetical protein
MADLRFFCSRVKFKKRQTLAPAENVRTMDMGILKSYVTYAYVMQAISFLLPFSSLSYHAATAGWLIMLHSTKNTSDRGTTLIIFCIIGSLAECAPAMRVALV